MLAQPTILHDMVWFGPVRNTRDIRLLRSHIDSGESVYVQKMTGDQMMIATVFREGNVSRPSTSEIGILLMVTVPLSIQPNELELQIASAQ